MDQCPVQGESNSHPLNTTETGDKCRLHGPPGSLRIQLLTQITHLLYYFTCSLQKTRMKTICPWMVKHVLSFIFNYLIFFSFLFKFTIFLLLYCSLYFISLITANEMITFIMFIVYCTIFLLDNVPNRHPRLKTFIITFIIVGYHSFKNRS